MKSLNFDIPDTDERGVSPVIGVILMVAITVILAAVIASFVLGFGGSLNENANAGVDVNEESDSVKVTWITQGNADTVELKVTNQSGNSSTATLTNVSDVVTINKSSPELGTGSTWDPTIQINESNLDLVVTAVNGDSRTVIESTTFNETSN